MYDDESPNDINETSHINSSATQSWYVSSFRPEVISMPSFDTTLFEGLFTSVTSTTNYSSTNTSSYELPRGFVVFVTDYGEKYHLSYCGYLSRSSHAMDIGDAIKQGYTSCSKCKPLVKYIELTVN